MHTLRFDDWQLVFSSPVAWNMAQTDWPICIFDKSATDLKKKIHQKICNHCNYAIYNNKKMCAIYTLLGCYLYCSQHQKKKCLTPNLYQFYLGITMQNTAISFYHNFIKCVWKSLGNVYWTVFMSTNHRIKKMGRRRSVRFNDGKWTKNCHIFFSPTLPNL